MIWHIPKPPGSGIGQALAEECVRRGCHVVLVDFDKDAVESVERDLAMETSKAQSVVSRVVDVTDVESIEALHAYVIKTFGQVHFVFNNAGEFGICVVRYIGICFIRYM